MTAVPQELSQPLAVIDGLFERAGTVGPPAEWGERQHFVTALELEDETNFDRIPCLNDVTLPESVPSFSLVRYRGLVQDIFEPEIYISVLEERDEEVLATDSAEAAAAAATTRTNAPAPPKVVTTKYREVVDAPAGRTLAEVARGGLCQRGACYMVPLPGETPWARAAALSQGAAAAAALAAASASRVNTPPVAKRRRPDQDVDMAADKPEATVEPPRGAPVPRAGADTRAAPARAGQRLLEEGAMRTAGQFGLNFPLPHEERRGQGASTACIVKLYDGDAEVLRVCDTVEVVGVLCVSPELAELEPPPPDEKLGHDARHPSTSLVPRLHAILFRKLPFYHPLLPFSPDFLSEARLVAAYQQSLASPGALAAARAAALGQLANHLGGDALAAEYVLMLLASRSFGKYGDQLLGAWSLNLADWPVNVEVGNFFSASAELVARAALVELSGATLGVKAWRPRKDFVANRLVAAQLQLAPGTLLILNETKMTEAQVSAAGVRDVKAIETLLSDHCLTCDFSAYDVQVPLELSCVLVSRGRSIIKTVDVVMPVEPATAGPQGPTSYQEPAPGSLDAARLFLGLLTRRPKALHIPAEVSNQFSGDFAAVRAELEVPSELCSVWLTLARAHCVTHGESELTADRWRAMLVLERSRLRRCQARGMLSLSVA